MVLLGKRGLDLSSRIESPERRVVGAVFATPDDIAAGVSATSLAPAPRMLFTKLRELAPAVKRIHVIYGADDNDWLIELARADAAKLGYELLPLRKESIREGASAYRELLKQIESPQDAIWLLQASPFLDENSVLQMVLRAAWDRNLVVFSSNPSHVPKGALFALFPDNNAMGRHLAQQLRKPASRLGKAAAARAAGHRDQHPHGRPPRPRVERRRRPFRHGIPEPLGSGPEQPPMPRTGKLIRSMSLQQLIGISFTACVLLLAVASSLVISKQSGDTVQRRLQDEGMRLVESLAQQSTLALLYEDAGSAAEVVKSFLNFPDVYGIELVYADGKRLYASDSLREARRDRHSPRPMHPALVAQDSKDWTFAAPVFSGTADSESPFAAPARATRRR